MLRPEGLSCLACRMLLGTDLPQLPVQALAFLDEVGLPPLCLWTALHDSSLPLKSHLQAKNFMAPQPADFPRADPHPRRKAWVALCRVPC